MREIADQATLNRATFYLHYPDKNALLQARTATPWGRLRAVALGVCDRLTEITNCPAKARLPLEGSIIPVVEGIFKGADHHALVPGVDAALLATTAAWAVFRAARRWFQTSDRIPAEEMAAKIEAMVKPVFLAAANC